MLRIIKINVNDISSKIIEEIDEYEKELIEFNKTNKKSLDHFNEIVKEMQYFHTLLNTEYLNKNEVDDKLIKILNEASYYFGYKS